MLDRTISEMLSRSDLLIEAALIEDKHIRADRCDHVISVCNPYDLSHLGSVPSLTEADIEHAINAASRALSAWSSKTAHKRSEVLMQWYQLIIEHRDDLAMIMTLEQGKPIAESRGEIMYAASFIQWFSEEAKRAYGHIIPSPFKHSEILVTKEPVGVCVAITPWNFPAAMITRKVGAALAAGCTMIVKPASQTPFTALALAQLAHEAGVPSGVLNVVTGNAAMIGDVIAASSDVKKISFTGSTDVGKQLMRSSAQTVKNISLELGGNAPFIVCEDADIPAAVSGLMASKFRNSGQTCICANRIYIHDVIYDEFIEAFAHQVAMMSVGNGLDESIKQGPLIDDAALDRMAALIDAAVGNGATLKAGGQRIGQCFEPSILVDVRDDMAICQEEIFGPVVPCLRFNTVEDVITRANRTAYGLASYIYSQDRRNARYIAAHLDYGMVAINSGVLSTEVAPFGGVKESGIGREGSFMGMDEYLEVKYTLLADAV